jgi:hypothetical protein
LRRVIIIGTAVAVLVGAAAAYANFNTYTGSKLAITKGGKGKALGMVQTLKASAPAGDRAAPLSDVKLKIYGVKLDAGKLPVCSDALILKHPTNPTGGCPKGSLIGSGPVTSLLGPGTNPAASAAGPCKPFLNVFNGGPKKQVFFFFTKHAGDCGGLTTGATDPYDAHISYSGGFATIDIPQPADISTMVAFKNNFYGSLVSETLSFPKKAGGKVYMAGTGCKKGKRPWSITVKNVKYGGGSESQSVAGSSAC